MTHRSQQRLLRRHARSTESAGARRWRGAPLRLGLLCVAFFLSGLFLVCQRARAQESVSEAGAARLLGRGARFRSLGASRKYYRVVAQQPGPVVFPLHASEAALLQPESIRLFKFNAGKGAWALIPDSKYDPRK